MRADRLVALLLLLQRRGQVTAAEVAEELEVSERTARRDLDALGAAGLPVYALQGRNGGWRLAGDGRTDLSGLSSAETRALFLLAGPSSATPAVRTALRKLVRALPQPFQPAAERAQESIVVDSSGWGRRAQQPIQPEHLDAVQEAVVESQQIRIRYIDRQHSETNRIVDPFGLAAKGVQWYLVASTESGMRTFRVDRIRHLERTGVRVTRPKDFDLASVWKEAVQQFDERRSLVRAVALVDPNAVGLLRMLLGTRVTIGPPVRRRVQVELRGHSVRSLAAEIAGFGAQMEVLEPLIMRHALRAIGRELVARYPPDS